MARKTSYTLSLGRLKHGKKKGARAYHRALTHGRRTSGKIGVEVVVDRYDPYLGGGFGARACLRRTKANVSRCGDSVRASTPTAAAKKALASLARKLK